MKVRTSFDPSAPPSRSPYRLLQGEGHEVEWANQFLDAQRLRGLSLRSLRAYAYDLLNLARWLAFASIELAGLTEGKLTDYILYQLEQQVQPAPRTINHRLTVAVCLYRFHYGREIPAQDRSHGCALSLSPPFGYARRRRVLRGLGVKVSNRIVVPLTATEVGKFWSGFRTFRDLSIIALMLFNGLRSCEVLSLKLEDLRFAQSQILVQGKGNRERLLPLDSQTVKLLESYLSVERPKTNSCFVFVVLKGSNRGKPLKPAGLRTVFRHHRRISSIAKANPHRFRHTFGADMVRAGISLPALMKLMGHSHIHTTMLYVQLCPQDVWREFHRATQNLGRPPLPQTP
jgi:site-specific recombinase XerD